MGLSALGPEAPAITSGFKSTRSSEDSLEATAAAFLPKLLYTAQILFGSSRSFFFSYDFDITRRWGECKPFSSEQPLYAQVEPTYFWNSHLLQPFLSVGAESVALPIMQGYVGHVELLSGRLGAYIPPNRGGKGSTGAPGLGAGLPDHAHLQEVDEASGLTVYAEGNRRGWTHGKFCRD